MRIGILGGGQLAMMLVEAAKKLNIICTVYSNTEDCPSFKLDQNEYRFNTITADYTDTASLAKFAEKIDVATYEFENIPLESIKYLEKLVEIKPSLQALKTFQNRSLEKAFLKENDIPHVPFQDVSTLSEFKEALSTISFPSVLKTTELGYDGKGQYKLTNSFDADKIIKNWKDGKYVLEKFLDLETEVSCIMARKKSGDKAKSIAWEIFENEHQNHILFMTLNPANISLSLQNQAKDITQKIADLIDYEGVLCVEFFIDKTKNIFVNEIAPRVHNSGHLTIENSTCSQFEQHLRAISNQHELLDCKIKSPAAMLNILGDMWFRNDEYLEPDFSSLPNNFHLHLYNKSEAKRARKMGHITVLLDDLKTAKKELLSKV